MNFKLQTLNKVLVVGNLLIDPETKNVSSSTVTNFRIACNRKFKDSHGNFKDKVCYINIVAWAKLAEICSEKLKKGDGVFVEGELQNRKLSNGSLILEVLADRVEFLTKKEKNNQEKNNLETDG